MRVTRNPDSPSYSPAQRVLDAEVHGSPLYIGCTSPSHRKCTCRFSSLSESLGVLRLGWSCP